MFRLSVLFIFMFSMVSLAHHDDNVGTAHHSGAGKVSHEGDYVDFTFNFSATCYDDHTAAWNRVSDNVDRFLAWLDETVTTYEGGVISYHVGLLNVWENEDRYAVENSCLNKYYGSQTVNVTLNRIDADEYLDARLVQALFDDLQVAIFPLSYRESSESNAYAMTKISSVRKGLFEETADVLRSQAKAKAQQKATRDFLAFLGPDYKGYWHLRSVDFSNQGYGGYIERDIALAPGVLPVPGGGPALSVLKLEPISVSVEGNFLFHFQIQNNYLP